VPLFLDPAAAEPRRAIEHRLTELLIEGLRQVAAGPARVTLDLARFGDELRGFDFAAPRPLEEVAAWAVAALGGGVIPLTHARYLGLFNPAPTFAAECADRIIAAFNPQLVVWSHAPAAVEIDRHVIEAVLRRLGFAVGPGTGTGGHFTSGGAESNLTALLCAATAACPAFAAEGARGFAGRPVLYASRESHLAWFKIAHATGLGREAVRLIATDGGGRMDVAALAAQLERDRAAGCAPVMIAATAGTTNAGMIDPLAACAEVAAGAGVWLHVDAAWGGALVASERLRGQLAGIERADSVTIDAHKWFATTMGAGMFFTRHAALLSQVFAVAASYMPSNDTGRDPYVTTMQWSRRFVGLRLFLGLAAAGWRGYAAHVERGVALLEGLGRELAAAGWTVVNASEMAILCLRPPAGAPPVRQLVDELVGGGEAWISVAQLEGEEVIRVCVTNGRTGEAELAEVAAALRRAASGGRT
jgi:glutamate/tyrosine decarboxylase-like PLP-dependent enzyme